MKQGLLVALAFTAFTSNVLAKTIYYAPQHAIPQVSRPGFVGPDAGGNTTVKELLAGATDDMKVIVTGHITHRVTNDKYIFADKTGQIVVEIDAKDMPISQQITPETRVKIYGKIDKKYFPAKTEIDVKIVEILDRVGAVNNGAVAQ